MYRVRKNYKQNQYEIDVDGIVIASHLIPCKAVNAKQIDPARAEVLWLRMARLVDLANLGTDNG